MEVVFNLRGLDHFTSDGLPVRSSIEFECVLRIGCWWFNLSTTDYLVAESGSKSDRWNGHDMSERASLTVVTV